jgi:hypothetical protein
MSGLPPDARDSDAIGATSNDDDKVGETVSICCRAGSLREPEIAELDVSAAASPVKKQIAHKTANTLQHPLFIIFAPNQKTIKALICDTDTSATNLRQIVAVLSLFLT